MILDALAVVGWSTCGAGFAAALWPRRRGDGLLRATLVVALSFGLLTQAMLWSALIRPGVLGPSMTAALALGLAIAGACAWRARGGGAVGESLPRAPTGPAGVLLALLALTTGIGILVNALAWPFADGDALAVLGPLGRGIAASGALPAGEWLYDTYPMHIPLLYAAVEWLRGMPSETWSRGIAALHAVGAVAVAGGLARDMRSPRAGWVAAALLTSTPMFCRWASSGYADVPAGFYLGLATWLCWRWWQVPSRRTALAAGLCAGLAAWTKNSSLTLVASAVAVPLAWAWVTRGSVRSWPRAAVLASVLGLVAFAAMAAPWYIRNLFVIGSVIPPTAWTDRAQPTLASLFATVVPAHGFGLLGWLVPALAASLLLGLRRRDEDGASCALVVAVTAPFAVAWWWFASYDPRFLVTVLPVIAAYAGARVDAWFDDHGQLALMPTRLVAAAGLTMLVASWALALRTAVEHKRQIVHAPWMDDVTRHRIRVGGLYEAGLAIASLPVGTRVAGVPPMARYYVDPGRIPDITWYGGGVPANARVLVVHRGAARGAPRAGSGARAGGASCDGRIMLETFDGYVVCERAPGAVDAGVVR